MKPLWCCRTYPKINNPLWEWNHKLKARKAILWPYLQVQCCHDWFWIHLMIASNLQAWNLGCDKTNVSETQRINQTDHLRFIHVARELLSTELFQFVSYRFMYMLWWPHVLFWELLHITWWRKWQAALWANISKLIGTQQKFVKLPYSWIYCSIIYISITFKR